MADLDRELATNATGPTSREPTPGHVPERLQHAPKLASYGVRFDGSNRTIAGETDVRAVADGLAPLSEWMARR